MLMQLTPFAVRKSIALRQMCAVHWPIYEDDLDDNDKELESFEAKKKSPATSEENGGENESGGLHQDLSFD